MIESTFITKNGWEKLNEEMTALWKDRKRVVNAVSEAAAMGDRSENAEYIYGRKRLREIDRRISYIHKQFKKLKVIEYNAGIAEKVSFGCWVEYSDQNNKNHIFQLVGTDETNIKEKKLSIVSPIGKALLYKTVGDTVEAVIPSGKMKLHIHKIYFK